MEKKLIRNRIQCKHCKGIIESKTDHDFQRCSCRAVGVDGGLSYPKRIYRSHPPKDHLIDLSEYE